MNITIEKPNTIKSLLLFFTGVHGEMPQSSNFYFYSFFLPYQTNKEETGFTIKKMLSGLKAIASEYKSENFIFQTSNLNENQKRLVAYFYIEVVLEFPNNKFIIEDIEVIKIVHSLVNQLYK